MLMFVVGWTVASSFLEVEIGGLNLWADQIGRSVSNGSPPLRYTLRHTTASAMKDLICLVVHPCFMRWRKFAFCCDKFYFLNSIQP